jgi:uncharacterized membrane protein YkvA (DUF1232 family)
MSDSEVVALLQQMVDNFQQDVTAIQAAIADGRTPDMARRPLATALAYVLERFDLIPDHLDGVGVVDDASVLRLCAKHAVSYGSDDPDLKRLAGEAAKLADLFDDLLAPLEEHVNQLASQRTEGRTPAETLADPKARMQLWKDIGQKMKAFKPTQLLAAGGDPAEIVKQVRKMVRARLKALGRM